MMEVRLPRVIVAARALRMFGGALGVTAPNQLLHSQANPCI